jgi:hypothetical protein
MTMVKCGDGDRGSERAMMGRMLRTYLLLRSVVAFREDTKQVFTIPAGALVRLPESMHRLGIEYTSLDGHAVMGFAGRRGREPG